MTAAAGKRQRCWPAGLELLGCGCPARTSKSHQPRRLAPLTATNPAPWQAQGMGLFTLDEARTELERLRPVLDEIIALRADAAELAVSVAPGGEPTELGGLAELKAAQARLDELVTVVQQTGVEIKGFAPLLLDFPSDLDGVPVLLCWLEGDDELAWYHRPDLGFAGRRRLP